MHIITSKNAQANLTAVMDMACADHAPVMITRPKAEPVVVVSLEDYRAIEATCSPGSRSS